MVNTQGQTENLIPVSQWLEPRTPSESEPNTRSQTYTPARLENDWDFFIKRYGEPEDYDQNKPLGEKQRDLFRFYERDKVNDTVQAWEWFLGRLWDEFDDDEKRLVLDNLNPAERARHGHLFDKNIKFDPSLNPL